MVRHLWSLVRHGELEPSPEPIAQIVEEATSLMAIDATERRVEVQLEFELITGSPSPAITRKADELGVDRLLERSRRMKTMY